MSNDFQQLEGARPPGAGEPSSGGGDAGERVEQLAAEIGETRGDLNQTIGAIGDRLDPANLAREATETVRDATLGKVEQMTYGAQETWRDVRTGNAGSLVDTITSNPVPASMVAVGLGLLFMSRGQQARRSHGFRGYRDDPWRDRASWEAAEWDRSHGRQSSPMDRVGDAVAGAGDRVGEVAGQAGQKAGEVVESMGEAAERLPRQAGMYLEQGSFQVRRFMDENPLGAGVIAVAAGAAIGMLMPTTPMERETIGPVRDQFVEKAERTVHEALDHVEQQADTATAAPARPA